VYISLLRQSQGGMQPLWLVGGAKSHCIWHGLPIPGCGEHCSKLITVCHVQFNMMPANLLKFSACSWISILSFTIQSMYVVVLFPKHRKDSTSWCSCLPEKISLNSVAMKASRVRNRFACFLWQILGQSSNRSWLYPLSVRQSSAFEH